MGKGKFTQELFDTICRTIATSSKGLKEICEANGVSSVAFYSWLQSDNELLNTYTRAREAQADYLADEIISISDHSEEDHTAFTGANVVQRDKLRVEARKWIAAKLKPKKYGDKVEIESNVNVKSLPEWLTKKIE